MIKKYRINTHFQDLHFPFHIQEGFLQTDYPIHRHDFTEVFIIFTGSADHILNDRSYPIGPGDVYVLQGQTTHGLKNVRNLRFTNISFLPDLFPKSLDLLNLPGYQALFVLEPFYRKEHQFRSHLTLPLDQLTFVTERLREMEREYLQKHPGYQSLLLSMLLEQIVYFSRLYPGSSVNDQTRHLSKLAQTIVWMHQHAHQPITIDQLSKRACMSKRHFIRVFKQNYHDTPIQYLLHKRLETAAHLLQKTDLPITEIAFKTGFSDSNYFTRQFHSLYHQPPKEYRKK